MKRKKTAIEECIERKPMNWSPLEDARDRRAMAELRALLALAQGVAKAERMMFRPCKVHPMTYAVAGLARLRRLGVLPEVRRG